MTKFYLKIVILILLIFPSIKSNSQVTPLCVVCVEDDMLITCGETVTLFGDGYVTSSFSDDFNSWTTPTTPNPTVWASVTAGGTTGNTTCTAAPTPFANCSGGGIVPAGNYLWFPHGSAIPRQATTESVGIPLGGNLVFEYKMEGQGGSCDGPDLAAEGTMIQYSTNNGITWIDMPANQFPFDVNPAPYTNIAYFSPLNPQLQTFNSWAQYSIPIPPAAWGPATKFRWSQTSASSTQYDFWGLENLNIETTPPAGSAYSWQNLSTGAVTIGQTLTANPTNLTNYQFTYVNGAISCSTTLQVDVAPPVVTPSIIPSANPCPNTIDLSAEASFNTCNYNVYLYDNGGNGWVTIPQTSTSIDNRIEVFVDGISQGQFTMSPPGAGANPYGPNTDAHGPVVYNFIVTAGGTFEIDFLSGGPNPTECAYFITDNQGNLITDNATPPNIISAMGLTTTPTTAIWPIPVGLLPSIGFTVQPLDFGPITTSCPTTNAYDYAWLTSPGGLTTGITTPLSTNTTVGVYPTSQDYQVCITDQLNPGCVGCSTITVPGNPSITTFDVNITSNNPLCSDGSNLVNLEITETSGTLIVGSGNYTFDIIDGTGALITSVNCTGFPHIEPILITPLTAGTYDFDILSINDITSGCQIYPTTTPSLISLTVNDPPNAGILITNPINLCQNELPDFYLPNAIGGTPDLNGVWSDAGGGNPDPTLPFNGYNYSLDPAILPAGNYLYQYTVNPPAGCFTNDFIQTTVVVTAAPTAGILPSTPISLCKNGSPINLNSLFNTSPACPTCALPVPFTGTEWTDITATGTGTPIGGGIPIVNITNWMPALAGTYLLRYTASASATCPNQDVEEVTIIVSDPPIATISTSDPNNQVCVNDLVGFDFNITGGIGNYEITYTLQGSPGLLNVTVDENSLVTLPVATGSTLPISTVTPGTYTYTIIQIEELNTGCIDGTPSSVTLTVVDAPYSGTTTSPTICEDDFTLYDLNNDPAFFPIGADAGGTWTYGGNPITGIFRAADNFGNSVDPFGVYTYTVNDPTGTCPAEFTDITIIAESPPNTGNALSNIEVCNNDASITNYNLNQLLDGSQDPGGNWTYNGLNVPNPIDLSTYPSLPTTHTFQYELTPPPASNCSNNGALPYTTICNLTINPEPQIDFASIIANPDPVSEGLPTNITVGMLSGDPPFTVTLQGNETPMGTYADFAITSGMSGSGSVTPNYDPSTNPITVTITSVTDNNGCVTTPFPPASTNVTITPHPIITASASTLSICQEDPSPVNLILTALQGTPNIEIEFSINGTLYSSVAGNINSISTLGTPSLSDISSLLTPGINQIIFTQVYDISTGCPDTLLPAPIMIEVYTTPQINNFSLSKNPICEDEDAIINFDLNSGVGQEPFNINYNYTGSPNIPFTTSIINDSAAISLVANGSDYIFTITSFTDNNGCIGIIPPAINLTVNETPTISLNSFIPSEICVDNEIYLNLQTPISTSPLAAPPYSVTVSGIPTLNYVLNNDGTENSGINVGNLITYTPNTSGNFPYTITFFEDANGCGLIDPINNTTILPVNETADMIVTSTADTGEICLGENAYIHFEFTKGSAPWEVEFIKNGSLIKTPPYSNSIAIPQGIYTNLTEYDFVSVNDIKGCIKAYTKNIEIIANNLPIAELTVDGSRFICDDGSTTNIEFNFLDGIPTYKVDYSVNGDNRYIEFLTPNPPTINTKEHGAWKITRLVDGNNCEATDLGDEVFIQVNPLPEPDFMAYPQPTDVNDPFIHFINESEGYISAQWIFNDLQEDTIKTITDFVYEFKAIADTHYVILEVMSDSGCIATTTRPIIINEAFNCFIPDAFTPNNDLYNDHFLPIVRSVREYQLSIYDRSGKRVFETNKCFDVALLEDEADYAKKYNDCMQNGCDEAWDGTINGNYSTHGVYTYSIEIIDHNGKERAYQGMINLIRY